MTTLDDLLDQFETDAARFDEVVRAGGDWTAPSPCEGWTAADVVRHVMDTQRDFLARQGRALDAPPQGAVAEAWAAHHGAMRAIVADRAFMAQEFDGVFGRVTVADTLARFYGFDLLVHRWDLARAHGLEVAWTVDELDRVERALDGFGEHLYDDGVCRAGVTAPADAPRHVRLLARMGRQG
ncbi:maleylpyruvate isomerase family mycothiol-dependent enzyme [Georgenia ruanii]|uniref:Maleylpyruvate isomerase family mycothiol-dependent enzyme n=2 Tax=Georgenia ruanii TaxID=348442 RepID=A0A7J9UYM3_9MICO|nr:maleylpyruvate isomerase family mycothiol-dependent enzyme [Georgenia ruanii]